MTESGPHSALVKDISGLEMPSCTGCRTCEMACSFRQLGQFDPKKSAIAIEAKEDGFGYRLCLDHGDTSERLRCTGCLECTRYCPVAEELKAIILGFVRQRRA